MASTVVRPSTALRSLRAADQPIETWSSCMALLGIESTDAGHGEPLQLADDRGLGVLGDHVAGVDAGVVGEERRQAVRAGLVEHPVGAALGDAGDVGDRDGQEVQHVARRARRGSCRWTRRGRRPGRPGLSTADISSRSATSSAWARLSRAAPCDLRGAAQRVGVLDAVAVRAAVALDDLRALQRRATSGPRTSAWPGCGRSACRSAANTRSVPSSASTLIAAVRSAMSNSRCRSAAASRSMPSMPSVPLVSARPSFSASTTGSMPACCKRLRRGRLAAGVGDLALAHQRERDGGQRARGRRSSRASRTRGRSA